MMPDPQFSPEVKQKLDALKSKIDDFTAFAKKEIKHLIAIELLPPERIPAEELKKLSQTEKDRIKDEVHLLVVVDLFNIKNPYAELEKTIKKAQEKAKSLDPKLKILVRDMLSIKEDCYDAKYETLQDISQGAPIYDPKDFINALRISEVHKTLVLKKFEKYIVSYVAVGSLFRGDKVSHDIDVYIVIDDTDVKKMTRVELRDRLHAITRKLGQDAAIMTGVKKQFHVQTYLLTDFWESVKDAQPVIYTFLRDGVPLYDRGVFMPWKLLLGMGRIRPSPEAIDMQMNTGERLIQRAKGTLITVASSDLTYALLNPAQAALMLYGMNPPTPRETIKLMEDIFVKKEKLLEKEYVTMLEKVYNFYKGIEHGKIKEVTGKDIDKFIGYAQRYLERLKKLFLQIQKKRDKESIIELWDTCANLVKDALDAENVKHQANTNLVLAYKKHLVDKKIMSKSSYEIIKEIEKTKKEFIKLKLSPQEIEKVRKEGRTFIRNLVEYIQRKKGYELNRAKVVFKYGDRYGEALLFEDKAFIIEDVTAKDKKVIKSKLNKDGSLGPLNESSMEEMEKEIVKRPVPPKVFIKERLFKDLRKNFGQDIEILINY
jgi:uncharacterized protein (UPF0332 family)